MILSAEEAALLFEAGCKIMDVLHTEASVTFGERKELTPRLTYAREINQRRLKPTYANCLGC